MIANWAFWKHSSRWEMFGHKTKWQEQRKEWKATSNKGTMLKIVVLRLRKQIPTSDEKWILVLSDVLDELHQLKSLLFSMMFRMFCLSYCPWFHRCNHKLAWTVNNSSWTGYDAVSGTCHTKILLHFFFIFSHLFTSIKLVHVSVLI